MITQICMTLNGARFGRSLVIDHGDKQLDVDSFRRTAVDVALARGLIAPGQEDDVDILLRPHGKGLTRKPSSNACESRSSGKPGPIGPAGQTERLGRDRTISRAADAKTSGEFLKSGSLERALDPAHRTIRITSIRALRRERDEWESRQPRARRGN
jgi:hypothetical protein